GRAAGAWGTRDGSARRRAPPKTGGCGCKSAMEQVWNRSMEQVQLIENLGWNTMEQVNTHTHMRVITNLYIKVCGTGLLRVPPVPFLHSRKQMGAWTRGITSPHSYQRSLQQLARISISPLLTQINSFFRLRASKGTGKSRSWGISHSRQKQRTYCDRLASSQKATAICH